MESRPPHGGRGLKLFTAELSFPSTWSSSTRGTWIEIQGKRLHQRKSTRRPPHGGRGLKWTFFHLHCHTEGSSSTRGTWIEIISLFVIFIFLLVVLHTGDVD